MDQQKTRRKLNPMLQAISLSTSGNFIVQLNQWANSKSNAPLIFLLILYLRCLQSSSRDDPPSPVSSSRVETLPAPANPPSPFDRSRSIIRRKALIKDLAAVYHAECLTYCQELLELQSKVDEPYKDTTDIKTPLDSRKGTMRPPRQTKKSP